MREDKTFAQNIMDAINSVLLELYGLTVENLAIKRRTADYVFARALAVYCYHQRTGHSYANMAEEFGRHRCTIYYICTQAQNYLKYDRKFAHDYKLFNDKINEYLCVNSISSTEE